MKILIGFRYLPGWGLLRDFQQPDYFSAPPKVLWGNYATIKYWESFEAPAMDVVFPIYPYSILCALRMQSLRRPAITRITESEVAPRTNRGTTSFPISSKMRGHLSIASLLNLKLFCLFTEHVASLTYPVAWNSGKENSCNDWGGLLCTLLLDNLLPSFCAVQAG